MTYDNAAYCKVILTVSLDRLVRLCLASKQHIGTSEYLRPLWTNQLLIDGFAHFRFGTMDFNRRLTQGKVLHRERILSLRRAGENDDHIVDMLDQHMPRALARQIVTHVTESAGLPRRPAPLPWTRTSLSSNATATPMMDPGSRASDSRSNARRYQHGPTYLYSRRRPPSTMRDFYGPRNGSAFGVSNHNGLWGIPPTYDGSSFS